MTLQKIKWFFLVSLVLFSCNFNCYANEDTMEHAHLKGTDPLFVSLGSYCESAWAFGECGIRKAAFPFDWIMSIDNKKIIKILEEDFAHFLDQDYLAPFAVYSPDLWYSLLNTYYHLEFLHDGDWNPQHYTFFMEQLIPKYQRRVERFQQLKHYKGSVVFVRTAHRYSDTDPYRCYRLQSNTDISENDSILLFNALKKYLPKTNFYLVIVNPSDNAEITLESIPVDHLIRVRANAIIAGKPNIEIPIKVNAYKNFYSLLLNVINKN